ncbi:MAG TPA: hypothetical protein VL588_04210 [Bdellovibrionota bacterium]|jgi:hypothetical protein|nr:hypothetical protein [Bdellovibrionota bacterium]
MMLESLNQWDPGFFSEVVDLRNELIARVHGSLRASLSDYEILLGPYRAFNRNHEWRFWGLRGPGGRLVGTIMASRPKDHWPSERFVPVGFFDCADDVEAARTLFAEAEVWARARGHAEIRGPIQGSFFHSYRLRLPGGGEPFYGEPVCPDYYHRLFAAAGFKESSRWKTILVPHADELEKVRQMLAKLEREGKRSDLRIRNVSPRDWDRELSLIHSMLSESFSSMPEYMPASLDEFREWYADFKHIIRKELSFVVEAAGRPVGFMIAYFDPLPAIRAAAGSRAPWRKILALWRIRRARGRLLVPYVGKLPSAEKIKGVLPAITVQLAKALERHPRDYYACYLAPDSPTYGAVPPTYTVHAEYVLYAKSLASKLP